MTIGSIMSKTIQCYSLPSGLWKVATCRVGIARKFNTCLLSLSLSPLLRFVGVADPPSNPYRQLKTHRCGVVWEGLCGLDPVVGRNGHRVCSRLSKICL